MFLSRKIVRSFYTSVPRMIPRLSRRGNPGVGHQIAEIDDAVEAICSDPEGFGDIESDLMEAHKSHRQYEQEVRQQHERIRHFLVKHKYFRDVHLPNLLTFAEKEQMRLLYARDPEEWSFERLAESFPTTPEIAKKVIKSNWRPYDVKRIRSHDAAVMRNWEELIKGSFDTQISPEFKEHLQTFASRRQDDLKAAYDVMASYTRPQLPKPKGNEFQAIITSCTKYVDSSQQPQLPSGITEPNLKDMKTMDKFAADDETYLLNRVQDKRPMRLQDAKKLKLNADDLQQIKGCNGEMNSNSSLEQPTVVSELKSSSCTGVVKETTSTNHLAVANYVQKFESNEIVISAEDRRRYEMTTIKDRIRIPRKVWRKGATYRVEDCYYDDDGEFLYRVPGMTG